MISGSTFFKSGSCIVCGQGTDTGIAAKGELEWHVAVLANLGVPTEQAITIVEKDGAPDGEALKIKVCTNCVSKSIFAKVKPALLIDGAIIPCITQPVEVNA